MPMIDIEIQNLSKSFGGHTVLQGISFAVQQGEHVGLLGANGAGKTTLLRLLCGRETPDSGTIKLAPGKTPGVLSQIPIVPPGVTALETLREAFRPFREMEARLREMEQRLDKEPSLLSAYGALSHQYEQMGGFETGLRETRVRQGLDLSDALLARDFISLSGGEKTRIHLARLMLEQSAILLLDEPTNHLDMRGVEWLEEVLDKSPGTVVIVSHDRFFLDNTIGRVIEIQEGRAHFYSGNYSFYAQEKERRYQEQLKKHRIAQQETARLEAVARRMHDYAGQNAKLHRRAFAIEKRAARIPAPDRPRRRQELRSRFSAVPFKADDVLRLEEVSKSFGGRTLFEQLTLSVRPTDRIALLGDNGTGKTTLISILKGTLSPDTGRVLPGPSVKMALLPQVVEFSHPERSLLDTLLYETNCSAAQARNRLGGFQFSGDAVFSPVETLSGGERSRLKLCILMEQDINFLMLDEPTNHLDIASREWIEQAVEAYEGPLLFISHDRYFIARFANRIWALRQGGIDDFAGGYGEYRQWLELQDTEPVPALPSDKPKPPPSPEAKNKAAERQRRAIERAMTLLEEKEQVLNGEMEANASDPAALTRLMEDIQALRDEWQALYTRWESCG